MMREAVKREEKSARTQDTKERLQAEVVAWAKTSFHIDLTLHCGLDLAHWFCFNDFLRTFCCASAVLDDRAIQYLVWVVSRVVARVERGCKSLYVFKAIDDHGQPYLEMQK